MIAIEEFEKMVHKQWSSEKAPRIPPAKARFVTGHPSTDSHLHLLEIKYGLRLHLDGRGQQIKSYEILDDKKFMMFTLRWS